MPRKRNKNEKILRPATPCAGTEVEYRRRLDKLVQEMSRSVVYWLRAMYRADPPAVAVLAEQAQDARTSAQKLRELMRSLADRWQSRFDEVGPEMAEWFAKSASARSDKQLQALLRKGGWSVRPRYSKAQRDILAATVAENVSLIRSIPQSYMTQIESAVMRSVQTGRDLSQLTRDIEKQTGVTRRRAAAIARDQNNKTNASLQRARQMELGIKEAIWMHSGAGKHPRPTHVRNNNKRYDIAKGWWDPAVKAYIHPGMLINCRCVSRPVIAGIGA